MNKITETIVQFKVSDKAAENAWGDLVKHCAVMPSILTTTNSGDIKMFLRTYEDEYIESYYSKDAAAKKKNGTWKYSNYLPNAYKSAKSVICRAADVGIPTHYFDLSTSSGITNIEPRGKSAVERDIQASTKSYATPHEDVVMAIDRHIKALKGFDIAGYHEDVIKQIKSTWLLE